jgi:hypothetical protein
MSDPVVDYGRKMSRHFPGKYLDTSVEAATAAGDRFMCTVSNKLQYTYPSESYEVRTLLDAIEGYSDDLMDRLADSLDSWGHEGMWAKTLVMFIKEHPQAELLEGFLTVVTKENLIQTYLLYVRVLRSRYVSDDPYMTEETKAANKRTVIAELADKISKYAMAVNDQPDKFPMPPLAGLTDDENGTIRLIIDHPEKRTGITDAIKERNSLNLGFLQQLVDADSTAISSGLL